MTKAIVTIEESMLGETPWAVIITRPQPAHLSPRTLWGRYAHQKEAQEGAKEAKAYLRERGELP